MNFIPEHSYHVYNRGNNQQSIFFSRDNYLFFLQKAKKEITPYADILAYCLMPNHFHLVLHVKEFTHPMTLSHQMSKLSAAIAIVLRSYTRALQKQNNFTGSLFQQKTKAKELIDNSNNTTINYLAICIHYIHQNPIRAKLVSNMEDWEFSSYRDYAGLRNGTLCNQELSFTLSGIDPLNFITESHYLLDDKQIFIG